MRTDVPLVDMPTSVAMSTIEADDPVTWHLEREVRLPSPLAQFVIPGDPQSKSRPRVTKHGTTYTPKGTVEAEERVAWTARAAGLRGPVDSDSSFGLMAIFFTATWQRRDVDNMLKLVADALTGVAWKDDSQVTEMSARVMRAVPNPRTHVLIYRTLLQRPDMRPCRACGTSYRVYKSWGDRKYCSMACVAQAARQRVELMCLACGEMVEYPEAQAARLKSAFCSERCRRLVQAPERVCAGCGVTFRKPRSQRVGQVVYCDRVCKSKHSGKVVAHNVRQL